MKFEEITLERIGVDVEALEDLLLGSYFEVKETDDLGAMMTEMDAASWAYTFPGLSDEEVNASIREQYAYFTYYVAKAALQNHFVMLQKKLIDSI